MLLRLVFGTFDASDCIEFTIQTEATMESSHLIGIVKKSLLLFKMPELQVDAQLQLSSLIEALIYSLYVNKLKNY